MKKLVFVVILFIIAIVGCQKNELNVYNVEVLVSKEGGTITPSGKILVPEGTSKKFVLMPESGFKTDLIVNGTSVPLVNNTYSLENIASDYKLEAVFKKMLSWDLMNGEWKQDSIIIQEINLSWSHYALWGKLGENQYRTTFLPSGRIAGYTNDKYASDAQWSLNETVNPPTICIGGPVWIIERLDEKCLILAKYDVPSYDRGVFIGLRGTKDIYSHHNK